MAILFEFLFSNEVTRIRNRITVDTMVLNNWKKFVFGVMCMCLYRLSISQRTMRMWWAPYFFILVLAMLYSVCVCVCVWQMSIMLVFVLFVALAIDSMAHTQVSTAIDAIVTPTLCYYHYDWECVSFACVSIISLKHHLLLCTSKVLSLLLLSIESSFSVRSILCMSTNRFDSILVGILFVK